MTRCVRFLGMTTRNGILANRSPGARMVHAQEAKMKMDLVWILRSLSSDEKPTHYRSETRAIRSAKERGFTIVKVPDVDGNAFGYARIRPVAQMLGHPAGDDPVEMPISTRGK